MVTRTSPLVYVFGIRNSPLAIIIIATLINENSHMPSSIPQLYVRSHPSLLNSRILIHQLLRLPLKIHQSLIASSTSKLELGSFQSAQAFSRCDIPAPVRVGEVLQQASNLPNLATLQPLANIASKAVLLLVGDRTRWQQHNGTLDPLRGRLWHKLEES